MKLGVLVVFGLLFFQTVFAGLSVPLFPEDGSQPIKSWYYSKKNLPRNYSPLEWDEFERVFSKHGIALLDSGNDYEWTQDMLFVDRNGKIVFQNDPGYDDRYFEGLTLGLFEYQGWGNSEIKVYEKKNILYSKTKTINFSYALLEGGGTITGSFADGSDYLILTHDRFNSMILYILDHVEEAKTRDQAKEVLAKDLAIDAQNLFVIPSKAGGVHLDLYIKALPGGVLLIDHPEVKLDYLLALKAKSRDQALDPYIDYYQNHLIVHKEKQAIIAREYLSQFFDIKLVPGRFTRRVQYKHTATNLEDVNFFNGISATDLKERTFYITNTSPQAKSLETAFTNFLKDFGFVRENIHYIGKARNGTGLDCFGTPSPINPLAL